MIPELDIVPNRAVAENVQAWLEAAIAKNTTDLTLMPEMPVQAEVNGERVRASIGRIGQSELNRLLTKTYGEGGSTRVPDKPLDYAFEIQTAERERRRFRFNVTRVFSHGQWGYHFSIRVLELLPPTLAKINLSEGWASSLIKDRGMVLVGGGTGHGKTTTLASIVAHTLQTRACKIVTIEAPIEYVYDEVPNKLGYACQHEVGKGIGSFYIGLVNALRQKPDIVLVGEIRDAETAETSTEAAMTGHPLLATIHANCASEMITRIVDMFPPSEKHAKSIQFLRNTNALIAQRLIPKKAGGKVAVREMFPVTADVRELLSKKDPLDWAFEIDGILNEQKAAMSFEIQKLVDEKTIDEGWIEWTKK